MGSKSGKTVVNTMASGRMIRRMGMAFLFMRMEIYMKGLGATIKHMATEPTNTPMVQPIMANGLRISSMVVASKNGQMAPNMKGNIKTAKNTEKAASHLQTRARIADRLKIMKSQESVNTFGRTGKCTKVNGKETKCTAMEF